MFSNFLLYYSDFQAHALLLSIPLFFNGNVFVTLTELVVENAILNSSFCLFSKHTELHTYYSMRRKWLSIKWV